MVTLTILPYTNVTLTFDWITLFMGDMGNCQAKKIKIWSWDPLGSQHQDELADRPSVAI
jgi:hypothetical protein